MSGDSRLTPSGSVPVPTRNAAAPTSSGFDLEGMQLVVQQAAALRDAALAEERTTQIRADATRAQAEIDARVRIAEIDSQRQVALENIEATLRDRESQRQRDANADRTGLVAGIALCTFACVAIGLFLFFQRGDIIADSLKLLLPAAVASYGSFQVGKAKGRDLERAQRTSAE